MGNIVRSFNCWSWLWQVDATLWWWVNLSDNRVNGKLLRFHCYGLSDIVTEIALFSMINFVYDCLATSGYGVSNLVV